MITYKFVFMEKMAFEAHKRPVYGVANNKSADILGRIEYYPRWRQWIYTPISEGIVLSAGCLCDIADFIRNHAGKE